jgi:uncharacterized protein (DUF1778 family)
MAATSETPARYARFDARLPGDLKDLLQRAADLDGQSLTDFVLGAAKRAAEETIQRHEVIELTARDSQLLAEALLNPPAPSARLRAAFEEYRRFTGEKA